MQLIIVRHGETAWTLTGQHTGITELELTKDGQLEVQLLRPVLTRLLGPTTRAVYSSPRLRAVATARAALPGEEVEIDPLLAEFRYGRYEGLTPSEIQEQAPGWNIWRDGCPGGETLTDVATRAREFISACVSKNVDSIVAVTHGHFSRVLAAIAADRPAEDAAIFASSTASVSVIRDHKGRRLIWLWNYTTRLDCDR